MWTQLYPSIYTCPVAYPSEKEKEKEKKIMSTSLVSLHCYYFLRFFVFIIIFSFLFNFYSSCHEHFYPFFTIILQPAIILDTNDKTFQL